MTNSPPNAPILSPASITQEECERVIMEALREVVGRGNRYSNLTLSEGVGSEERTIKKYVDGDGCPPLKIFLRLCAELGPGFANHVLAVAGLGGATRLAPAAINEFQLNRCITQLVAALGRDLEDGQVDHSERARLLREIPRVIEKLADFMTRYSPAEASQRKHGGSA